MMMMKKRLSGPLLVFSEPHLRHVETDVLIPKLMREKAKVLCDEKVQGVYLHIVSGLNVTS